MGVCPGQHKREIDGVLEIAPELRSHPLRGVEERVRGGERECAPEVRRVERFFEELTEAKQSES